MHQVSFENNINWIEDRHKSMKQNCLDKYVNKEMTQQEYDTLQLHISEWRQKAYEFAQTLDNN